MAGGPPQGIAFPVEDNAPDHRRLHRLLVRGTQGSAGGAQTVLTDVNTDDVHVNTWLTTGRWMPGAPIATCILTAAHADPQPHKKKHKKRRRHHPRR